MTSTGFGCGGFSSGGAGSIARRGQLTPVHQQSVLSDALLRQLIAVGQVDILVGLPTLNNAATVADVVRAVHVCFARNFPRLRAVLINSDGGSTDETPELIRSALLSEADTLLTLHSLRTLHLVVAPYHGLPGKLSARRTVFAAAELTQAKVLVVLDPAGPATSAERVTELISPIAGANVEFVAPCHQRHPPDGVLVTQLVRPLVRSFALAWDYETVAGQARYVIGEIRPLLAEVLDATLLAGIVEETSSSELRSDDELWVKRTFALAAAGRQGRSGPEHLAGLFVPLYLWRATAFTAQAAHQTERTVHERLESLCQTFLRLKPVLVSSWLAEV